MVFVMVTTDVLSGLHVDDSAVCGATILVVVVASVVVIVVAVAIGTAEVVVVVVVVAVVLLYSRFVLGMLIGCSFLAVLFNLVSFILVANCVVIMVEERRMNTRRHPGRRVVPFGTSHGGVKRMSV